MNDDGISLADSTLTSDSHSTFRLTDSFIGATRLRNMLSISRVSLLPSSRVFAAHQIRHWKHKHLVAVGLLMITPLILALVGGDVLGDIQFYHVYGSVVSIACCAYVYMSYFSIRKKGRNPNYVSSPPVILLLGSVTCDLASAIVTILDSLDDDNGCLAYAVLTEFSMIGSVVYIVLLSVDLLVSVEFSFMNHRVLMPWYHAIALGISSFLTLLLIQSKEYGESVFFKCWIEREESDSFNTYNWILINVPFLFLFSITIASLLIVYYRLGRAKARKLHEKRIKESKLTTQLNGILKSQSIQTGIICSFYMFIALQYGIIYLQDHTFPVNFQLNFLTAVIAMKAVPNAVVWQMRVPRKEDEDRQTLEEYTMSKLAESRRLDIIQTCSQCIKESAQMSAGPSYHVAGRAKYHDFESVLLLNVRGEASGVDFRFKTYGMRVFRHIREASGLSTESYSNAFRPDRDMKERFSEGQSGSFLYFTEDGKYVVKTVTKHEKNYLLDILPHYYKHILDYPDSNLVRYVGVHSMSMYGQVTYLVVMRNVMPNTRLRKYDLKGSIVGRSVFAPANSRRARVISILSPKLWTSKKDVMKSTQNTLKDADFLQNEGRAHFPPQQFDVFITQLKEDVRFLISMNVMDYSLLVGIVDYENTPRPGQLDSTLRFSVLSSSTIDLGTREHPRIFAGVIDILQKYTILKRLEHFLKTRILGMDPYAISCADPSTYGKRFLDFIANHFD